VPARVWEYAKRKHYVSESSEYPDPVGWLSTKVQELLELSAYVEAGEFLPNRRHRRQKVLPIRVEVVSKLLAAIARTDPDVKAFRDKFLAGGILKREEVPNWIEENREKGRFRNAVILSLPRDVRFEWRGQRHSKVPMSALRDARMEDYAPTDFVEYAKPGDRFVHMLPVGRDGTLRRLVDLANALAARFSWQEAQATTFVLTDLPPLISTQRVEVTGRRFTRTDPSSTALQELSSSYAL